MFNVNKPQNAQGVSVKKDVNMLFFSVLILMYDPAPTSHPDIRSN